MEEGLYVMSVTRTTKVNIPQLIEDFYYSLQHEEYEEYKELKEFFYNEYYVLSEKVRDSIDRYVRIYLDKHEIDNERDLNGLFNKILQKGT